MKKHVWLLGSLLVMTSIWAQAQRSNKYSDVLSLFREWRAFEQPPL
ncbi:MAG TPA: hypothetical protein VLL95_06075 [Phnomibacter sp.]|nr:hypothetical protein [Phnomibacter sp.]